MHGKTIIRVASRPSVKSWHRRSAAPERTTIKVIRVPDVRIWIIVLALAQIWRQKCNNAMRAISNLTQLLRIIIVMTASIERPEATSKPASVTHCRQSSNPSSWARCESRWRSSPVSRKWTRWRASFRDCRLIWWKRNKIYLTFSRRKLKIPNR